jgi:hypothetical protein
MSEKIETVADYAKLMLETIDKRDAEAAADWKQNSDGRVLKLIDIVLEKTKTEAMKDILPRARGMTYMNLERKIQQQEQNIKKLEQGLEREFQRFHYLPKSTYLIRKQVVEAHNAVTASLVKVFIKNQIEIKMPEQ